MQRVQTTVWSPAGDRKIYAVWVGVIWAALLAGFGLSMGDFWREAMVRLVEAWGYAG